jgi:hypothetical protein
MTLRGGTIAGARKAREKRRTMMKRCFSDGRSGSGRIVLRLARGVGGNGGIRRYRPVRGTG